MVGWWRKTFSGHPDSERDGHERCVFTHLEQNGQTFLEMRHGEKFNVLLPLNRLRNKNEDVEKSGRIQAQREER